MWIGNREGSVLNRAVKFLAPRIIGKKITQRKCDNGEMNGKNGRQKESIQPSGLEKKVCHVPLSFIPRSSMTLHDNCLHATGVLSLRIYMFFSISNRVLREGLT